MDKHFDIAVLGAGPGGYVAALKAGQMGASVAIIEKQHLGGTCLNFGCIPSKALLASAQLFHHIQHASEMGIELPGPAAIDWTKIQARKNRVVQALRTGIKGLLGARKVCICQGAGRLDGAGRIAVTRTDGSAEQITADKIVLAVGSQPSTIPGWPTDAEIVTTSDEALHWKTLPKRLLIVGGGVIGCEFACMMRALGVEVTIVEMLPQLLPNMDSQVADALTKIFKKRGITVLTGVKIDDLAIRDNAAKATLADGQTIDADRVLVATGRRPNTNDIGLDSVGLAADRRFVPVNDRMETTVPGYYVIGDANGRCLLAHAASAQAIVAVENALGHERSFDAPVPNCIYTFPEIASVGLTAEAARAKDMPVSIGKFPLGFLGKAMAANDTDGFVKIVRHRETDEILGVHAIGHNATEWIAAAGVLLYQRVTAADAAEIVFAHPTMSESIKEAAEDALSMGLHLPPRKMLRAMAEL